MKLSARVQPLQKQKLYLDHPNSPVHMNFLANLSFVKYTYFDRRKRNPAIHPNHRECMVFLVLFVSVFISFFLFIRYSFLYIYQWLASLSFLLSFLVNGFTSTDTTRLSIYFCSEKRRVPSFKLFLVCLCIVKIESRGVPNDIRRLSRITFVGVPDCYSVPKNNTFLFST